MNLEAGSTTLTHWMALHHDSRITKQKSDRMYTTRCHYLGHALPDARILCTVCAVEYLRVSLKA